MLLVPLMIPANVVVRVLGAVVDVTTGTVEVELAAGNPTGVRVALPMREGSVVGEPGLTGVVVAPANVPGKVVAPGNNGEVVATPGKSVV